jgi:hypothetical protein
MKVAATIGALLCVLGAASEASAQAGAAGTQFYGNLGYTLLDGGEETDVNLNGVTARLGVRQRSFGVEAEGNLGLGNETVRIEGIQVETGLEHQFAGYAVAFAQVSPTAELFARIGYGQLELEAEFLGRKERVETNILALGVGGQYFFGAGANGVRLDYTRFEFEEDGDSSGDAANTFSVAYVRRF